MFIKYFSHSSLFIYSFLRVFCGVIISTYLYWIKFTLHLYFCSKSLFTLPSSTCKHTPLLTACTLQILQGMPWYAKQNIKTKVEKTLKTEFYDLRWGGSEFHLKRFYYGELPASKCTHTHAHVYIVCVSVAARIQSTFQGSVDASLAKWARGKGKLCFFLSLSI